MRAPERSPVALPPLPPGMELILASASPRRAALLNELGIAFRVVESGVEEIEAAELPPAELVRLNARRKAERVAALEPDALVIGADTTVCIDDEVFGKPTGIEAARRMLTRLQGREHHVLTAVCVVQGRTSRCVEFVETTRVRFRPLDAAQIDAYVARVHTLDKAGGYAIQERGGDIVHDYAGSYSNVVGLPVERLVSALRLFRQR
jgi:septum formation protein